MKPGPRKSSGLTPAEKPLHCDGQSEFALECGWESAYGVGGHAHVLVPSGYVELKRLPTVNGVSDHHLVVAEGNMKHEPPECEGSENKWVKSWVSRHTSTYPPSLLCTWIS